MKTPTQKPRKLIEIATLPKANHQTTNNEYQDYEDD